MSKFVESVNVKTVLWQLPEEEGLLPKTIHVSIEHMDRNLITLWLQNGVHVSLGCESDGKITLSGWIKLGENPVFELTLVNSEGRAVEDPLKTNVSYSDFSAAAD